MTQNIKLLSVGTTVLGTCCGYYQGIRVATRDKSYRIKYIRKTNEPIVEYRRYAKNKATKDETVWPTPNELRYYDAIQVVDGSVIGGYHRF